MNFQKNKLIFFEGDMIGGRGHHLDNLIEVSIFFSNKFNIMWFVNNKFNSNNLFIPKNIKIKNIIKNNDVNKLENQTLYLLLEIFIYLNNLIFFISLAINKKKIILFMKFLIKNFFVVPQYFQSFYSEFIKHKINENDHLVIQSCREKDICLVYFLLNIETIVPKIHIRLLYPPKKKFKGFYFYLKNIKNFIDKKRVIIYTEIEYLKKLIEEEISELRNKIFVFNQIYSFYNREKKNILTIGFVGEARPNKGFNLLPHFINSVNQLNNKINFIIQFSKIHPETEVCRSLLIQMKNKISNLTIIEKYCDFFEYREILQKIDVMPILYPLSQTNTVGSGVFYSCLTNEISMIIPKNSTYLKKILKFSSYEEAEGIDEYIEKAILMVKNYDFYLNEAKKQSLNYKSKIEFDPFVRNIIKNDYN